MMMSLLWYYRPEHTDTERLPSNNDNNDECITGDMMMSLLWYYRPEHTDTERLPSNNDNDDDCITGDMMMSLLWYYRPEHTDTERLPSHVPAEIFASKHRDETNVACIDDKCFVLTLNEYCR